MSVFGSSFRSVFSSVALGQAKIRVEAVRGTERLGQLYEYRARIVDEDGALTEDELAELLAAPCYVQIGDGDPVNGIAREVCTLEAIEGRAARYEVVIVPTMWLLTISKLSHLYQAMSVKDMAAEVLGRYGLTAHADLRVQASSPRELCIQYEESDWHYLQRWFEHEGYFYWFEHSADGEKLVIADANEGTKPISGDATLPYRDLGGLERDRESVFRWRGVQRRVPAHVVLKDYSDQKPLLAMVGQADVDRKRGFGVFFEYGDNFETPAAGNALAQRRAERFLTEQLTLKGETDCVRFHVGHSFELADHFDEAQNRKYLITAIDQRVGASAEDGGGADEYVATFEAIPLDVQYRPERRTPWPSIHGLMHGHIDSDSTGKFSTLDPQARYRVRFPFDNAGKTGESCSTWLRMAQSYSGSGYGSHFPLHKGTEVVLAFYDGDPDRPIIVGSVPNALTPGPSASANATQSGHKTASGIQLVMDDDVSKS